MNGTMTIAVAREIENNLSLIDRKRETKLSQQTIATGKHIIFYVLSETVISPLALPGGGGGVRRYLSMHVFYKKSG